MTNRAGLSTASIAAIFAATLSTAAFAQDQAAPADGPKDGAAMMFPFDAMDADKDGKVTKAEMDAYRAAQVGDLDADKNGQISVEELVARDMKRAEVRATARAKRMMERLDANGDGQLSAAELASPPRDGRMFDRMDTDKDGAISKAEAEAAQAQMQKRWERHGHKHKRMQDQDDN